MTWQHTHTHTYPLTHTLFILKNSSHEEQQFYTGEITPKKFQSKTWKMFGGYGVKSHFYFNIVLLGLFYLSIVEGVQRHKKATIKEHGLTTDHQLRAVCPELVMRITSRLLTLKLVM